MYIHTLDTNNLQISFHPSAIQPLTRNQFPRDTWQPTRHSNYKCPVTISRSSTFFFSEPESQNRKFNREHDGPPWRKVEAGRSSERRLVRDCVSSLYFISPGLVNKAVSRERGIGYLMSPPSRISSTLFNAFHVPSPSKSFSFSFLFLLLQPRCFSSLSFVLLPPSHLLLSLVHHRQRSISLSLSLAKVALAIAIRLDVPSFQRA